MDIVIVGPGRAGGSIGLAAQNAGHRVVGVVAGPSGRIPDSRWPPVGDDSPLPGCDLLILSVRDDLLPEVGAVIARRVGRADLVAHLSGFTSISVLEPFRDSQIGSVHPLQTLPDPLVGSGSLAGAWAAITGAKALADFASSLGMRPFALADQHKPAYHAGASSAANFVVECLAVAEDLFAAAGAPLEALRPLVERVVANAFDLGPRRALTGPVVRGDTRTVLGQIETADLIDPGLGGQYRHLVAALSMRARGDRS